MAQINYDAFAKYEANRQQNRGNNSNNYLNVGYFQLKNDNEEAIVRFNIADIKDVDVFSVHQIDLGGKKRKVACLRGLEEDVNTCPLCREEYSRNFRVFIPLVKYTVEGNEIKSQACIWEQSPKFRETLKTYFNDYGDLRNYVFKVVRHGAKGYNQTSYTLIPTNPQVFKPELYVADFTAFDSFNLNSYMLLNRSFDDLQTFVDTGAFAFKEEKQSQPAQTPIQPAPAAQTQPTPNYTQPNTGYVQQNPYQGYNNPIYGETPQQFQQQPQQQFQQQAAVNPTNQAAPGNSQQQADPTAGRPRRYTY